MNVAAVIFPTPGIVINLEVVSPKGDNAFSNSFSRRFACRWATCHTCERPMQPMRGLANVLFDYCITCRGMFLDAGELSAIQAYKTKHGV